MAAVMPTYRFSVDEYERMVEAGVFDEDARVELIRGEIVTMSPVGGKHVTVVGLADRAAQRQLGADLLVLAQSPIRLPTDGEPQPDLAIVRFTYYDPSPPSAEDVFLVIEVGDSSRDHDRTVKLPLYAEAGIPEAWLFDIVADVIERHTEPIGGHYRHVATAGRGQRLASLVLPNLTFDVAELLGPTDASKP
jgi:Uma2 family endonuclease